MQVSVTTAQSPWPLVLLRRRDGHRYPNYYLIIISRSLDTGVPVKRFDGNVLALDLATVTGWAWGKPGSVPKFGHERFAKKDEDRPVAYRRFRLWLDLFCSAHPPALIVYESPAVPAFLGGKTNINTTKLLFGLCEHLEEWAHEKFPLREAMVSQVRAHFIGRNLKSAIAKELTQARCRELGWPVENADQADAVALWDYQCAFLRPDLAVSGTPLFSR